MYYNELNERERFYSVAPSDQPPTDQRSQAGHDATVKGFRRIDTGGFDDDLDYTLDANVRRVY